MEHPLLSGEARGMEDEGRRSYQHVGRSVSVHVPSSATCGEVSVDEIRAASIFSESIYPPSIHGALVSSSESNHQQDEVIVSHAVYGKDLHGYGAIEFGRQILDEVEIRHLLIDHVGHHYCWGSRPARTWKISSIEDCNVYVGTLETFIEERETIRAIEPYSGGEVDGKSKGATELAVWELDLRSEFPLLFVPYKETSIEIPHSEALEKCADCEGKGELACPTCNAGQEPGLYKPNQVSQCSACYGRGLIAHQDGSDTKCKKCNGTGKLPCVACGSRGLINCQACGGQGSLLTRNTAFVRWYV